MEEHGSCRKVQGRWVTDSDLEWIRQYRSEHPEARRKRIAIELCEHWQWRNGRGHLKEMAARSLLNKLADRGLAELPALRQWTRRKEPEGRSCAEVPCSGAPIECRLADLQPLSVHLVQDGDWVHRRWAGYLRGYLPHHAHPVQMAQPQEPAQSIQLGELPTSTGLGPVAHSEYPQRPEPVS